MPYRSKTTHRQRARFHDRHDPVRTVRTPAVDITYPPIVGKTQRPNPRQRAEALSTNVLNALDGPARFEDGPPEAWRAAHDAALTAHRNNPVKHCPFGVLYWTRAGAAAGQVIHG